jgi:hypothetical protein
MSNSSTLIYYFELNLYQIHELCEKLLALNIACRVQFKSYGNMNK